MLASSLPPAALKGYLALDVEVERGHAEVELLARSRGPTLALTLALILEPRRSGPRTLPVPLAGTTPQLGFCSGCAWWLWAARHSQGEADPSLGAQPLPRALELAASKPADSHRH